MKKCLLLLLVICGCESDKTGNFVGTKWQFSESGCYYRRMGLLTFIDGKEFVDSIKVGYLIAGTYSISNDTIILKWNTIDAVDHHLGSREKVNIEAVHKLILLEDKLFPVYFALKDSGKYFNRSVSYNEDCFYKKVGS